MPTSNVDLYQILGVERASSPEDIKKAYRRLARQYHPDVSDAPDADERFKEINLAYEVLSDPQRRRQYDQFGTTGSGQGMGGDEGFGGGGFGSINDIFDFFFGGGGFGGVNASGGRGGRAGYSAGADIHRSVTMELEDCLSDYKETINVSRRESCSGCSGSGSAPGTTPEVCATCGGRGMVIQVRETLLGRMQTTISCPRCHGEGRIITDPCKTCRGSGFEEQARSIEVTIPAGVDNGNILRVSGQGHSGRGGAPAGDLLVTIHIPEDKVFAREGTDLHVTLPVHYTDLVLGASVSVPTLTGEEKLRIPAGTESHHSFTLRGHGIPRLRGGGRGNLHVLVTLALPEKLSKEQKELLLKLRAEDTDKARRNEGLFYKLLHRK